MKKFTVQVIATISNQWATTEYKWQYHDIYIAEQQIETYKRIYGERFKILSIKYID